MKISLPAQAENSREQPVMQLRAYTACASHDSSAVTFAEGRRQKSSTKQGTSKNVQEDSTTMCTIDVDAYVCGRYLYLPVAGFRSFFCNFQTSCR